MIKNKQPSRLQVHVSFVLAYVLLWVVAGWWCWIFSALNEYIHYATFEGLDYLRGFKCGVAEIFGYPMRVHKRCIKHYKEELDKCSKD